jgi:PAS domain S-box-containing protein
VTATPRETILLVDDDPGVAAVVREFLEDAGHAVEVAHTGTAARQRLSDAAVDLVLLDLVLPDLDGLALLRDVQALEAPPEVIIVTGHATLASAVAAVEAGAAGYLEKPVDLPTLNVLVERTLERRGLRRENRVLAGELDARRREADALYAISSTLVSTLDLREALRRICRELARLFGADSASAYVHDDARDRLVPFAAYHVPKEHLSTLTDLTLPLHEQGFYLPLWRERRPVWSDAVAEDHRFSDPAFRRFPHQSGLMLPLVLDDAVAGAFYLVWWTARQRFADEELRLAAHVTGQASLFLRNARLWHRAEQDRRRLEVLNELSRRLAGVHDTDQILSLIVEEAPRLLGAEAAALHLVDGDELVLRAATPIIRELGARQRLHVGESLSGAVVANGRPVVVEDMLADARLDPARRQRAIEFGHHGFLGVPLRARARVVGTLNVYTGDRRRFSDDDVALLSAFADHASLALEKGRLLQEAGSARDLLTRLYGVGLSMQTSWSRDERLAAFVRGVRDILGFDRVDVYLQTEDDRLHLVTSGAATASPPLGLPLSSAAGPFHCVFRTRRPLAVLSDADLAAAPPLDASYHSHPALRTRRFVIAPLAAGDRAIGVVVVDNKPTRRPIDPVSVEPFALLCQQLAAALEEARLHAETLAREQEIRELYANLEQRVMRLHALGRINQLISASLDTAAVLAGIARAAAELMDARVASFWLADEPNGVLETPTFSDEAFAADFPTRVVRFDQGILGWVATHRKPLSVPDVHADGRIVAQGWWRAHGLTSFLGVPVIHQDALLAVLSLNRAEPFDLASDEDELLQSFIAQAAIAINNARLFDEARSQRARLAQIFESTSDGMMLVRPDGQMLSANRRAGELLGFDPERSGGLGLTGVLAAHFATAAQYYTAVSGLRAALERADHGDEGDLELSRSGRILHWVARPVPDADGGSGLTLTFHDVTHEREVSRMKSDFISFVTHQLRTPLAGIKWMLELAGDGATAGPDTASYIADASAATERLIGLVNDLLDVARLESARVTVSPASTDVLALTRQVLEELDALVRPRGQRVAVEADLEADARGATIEIDPQLARQVITNLLSNAVKYTPPGGAITVRIARDGSHLAWSVADSGIGVPKEAQRRLFEKFFRADNALAVETEGTGLGLYIVKLIVERLGGSVRCESEEGQGAVFTVTLPA